MVWYSHLLKNFPQFVVIHTVKGFGIVCKAEIDVFLQLFCFFNDLVDVGSLISGPSAFSKSNLNIWKFTVHILLKPSLKNFEHYFASMWDGWNCAVVWAFFGIAFLWDWNENWPFLVLQPLLTSVVPNSFWPYVLEPVRLLCPWGSSRQKYWSGLSCPHPGDLPNSGIEPTFLKSHELAGSFCTTSATLN